LILSPRRDRKRDFQKVIETETFDFGSEAETETETEKFNTETETFFETLHTSELIYFGRLPVYHDVDQFNSRTYSLQL